MEPHPRLVLPACVACLAGVLRAGEAAPVSEQAWPLGERWRLTLEPDVAEVYPRYLADPRRPQNSVGVLYGESEIPEASGSRFALGIGARLPLARLEAVESPTRVQLYVDGAYFGQFDRERSLDEIGWDGWYAGHLALDPGGPLRLKAALRHLSSHLGDEYVLATGAQRVDYTRQDASLAIAWMGDGWSTYLESGRSWQRNYLGQARVVVQAGAQIERPAQWGRLGWFAATDVSAFSDEDDWRPNVAASIGLTLPLSTTHRVYRLALNGYDGRGMIGEHRRFDERFIGWSLGVDF